LASIVHRGKAYNIVYSYKDENGVHKQKWETFHIIIDIIAKENIVSDIVVDLFDPIKLRKSSPSFLFDQGLTDYGMNKLFYIHYVKSSLTCSVRLQKKCTGRLQLNN
jgi:hypothetical protein